MSLIQAVDKAVDFILKSEQDGQWQDYCLPVGVATEWATAYIGWALAEAANYWHIPKAAASAKRAANWLSRQRSYAIGWGYNNETGPDSDSTACAVALLDTLGYPVAEEDRAFLRRAWQESAGFVTYCEGPGAWSEPHLDILWPAFRGAQLDSPQQCWQSLQSKLDADFDVGSGWHGYWWKGPWYCTYHVLLAAHWLDDKSRFCFTPESGPLSTDSFSSAGWIAGSLLLSGHTNAGLALFNQIADSQRADGSWDSSADLRVTNPEVSVPDESPLSGQLYADQNRLMTTASVLRALCTEPCKAELAKV